MRRIVKTTKTPEDSFFRIIQSSVRMKGIVDFQRQALKKWKGVSNLPNRIAEAMERSWSDSALRGEWMIECCGFLMGSIRTEHGVEALNALYLNEQEEFLEDEVDAPNLIVGGNKYSLRQISLAMLLSNTVCDPLVSYYSLWGAKELSPSHQLLEEFTILESEYEFENLPFLSWVYLKGFGLKSSTHSCIIDYGQMDYTMNEDIVGVMVVNLNEVYKKNKLLINPLRLWDEVAYVFNQEEYIQEAYKDHVMFCVFTTNKNSTKSDVVLNGTFICHFDQVEEQICIISEGLGESLSAMFMPGCGRRVGIEEGVSSGQDLSDYGLAFDLALKTIKYSESEEKVFTSSSYPHPIQLSSNQSPNAKRKKKGKKVKNRTKYFQIEYLKMPREDKLPLWFKKDNPSTPRTKSIDPRFMSSHYRRIWVTDSYIEKKEVPEEQVLAIDDSRPRYNKHGILIYKKRSLVAIKIDTGHEPLATVTRMS